MKRIANKKSPKKGLSLFCTILFQRWTIQKKLTTATFAIWIIN